MRICTHCNCWSPRCRLTQESGDPLKDGLYPIQYFYDLSGNVVSVKLPFTFTRLSKESELCMTLPQIKHHSWHLVPDSRGEEEDVLRIPYLGQLM